MRILHIAPTPFFSDRGCHIRIGGLIRAMNDHGIRNRLCTYPIGRDSHGVDTVRCLSVPGYKKTAPGPSAYKLLLDPLLVLTTIRQIRKFKPDVLHCHLHEGVLVGWLAKYMALRPDLTIGFDMQGGLSSELQSYGHLRSRLLRTAVHWIEAFVIARARYYFCSSEASTRLLHEEFDIDGNRIVLVPDGADVGVDHADSPPLKSAGHAVAVYTGGLAESKGLSMLQQIIKEASDRNIPVTFRIVGYPTEQLDAFIRSHELKNCTLLGRVPFEELGKHLRDATVSLEPKSGDTSEASGKLLNYMAAALPVVCFDTTNNRALLGDTGCYASEPTAAAFVDRLFGALENPSEARQRGRHAQERLLDKFSWASSARKILAKYGERHFKSTPESAADCK